MDKKMSKNEKGRKTFEKSLFVTEIKNYHVDAKKNNLRIVSIIFKNFEVVYLGVFFCQHFILTNVDKFYIIYIKKLCLSIMRL